MFCTFLLLLLLLLLSGCSIGDELTEWAAGKANDTLEAIGGGVQEVIDDLHDAEYQGGPFENNLDAARAYLLEQMQEKFGKDIASVVADPGFEDAAGRDFSLKKDSKAVALGFVPIDIRDCGAAGTGA